MYLLHHRSRVVEFQKFKNVCDIKTQILPSVPLPPCLLNRRTWLFHVTSTEDRQALILKGADALAWHRAEGRALQILTLTPPCLSSSDLTLQLPRFFFHILSFYEYDDLASQIWREALSWWQTHCPSPPAPPLYLRARFAAASGHLIIRVGTCPGGRAAAPADWGCSSLPGWPSLTSRAPARTWCTCSSLDPDAALAGGSHVSWAP